MTSIKIVLREAKRNKAGKSPVYIRVIKFRKTSFISTGIYLHSDEWDDVNSRVKKKNSNSAYLNSYLSSKKADAEVVTLDMEAKNEHINVENIKNKFVRKAPVSFFEYAEKFIEKYKGSTGTYRRYKAAVAKLKKYVKNKLLFFDDIDFRFLSNYETYLLNKLENKQNTIHSNFKIIKQIFLQAVNEGLVSRDNYPFSTYKVKQVPTNRDYLSESELIEFEKVNTNSDSWIFLAQKMYIFSAYAGGIRISDLLLLTWDAYDGEKLSFKIKKTSNSIVVKLPNKAVEIIEYFKEMKLSNRFIFPVIEESIDLNHELNVHTAINRCNAMINKKLKVIANKAKINKAISFHTSRHTWATRALRKGMRIEYVSKIMGHADIKETQIYVKIVNEELEKAMEIFNE